MTGLAIQIQAFPALAPVASSLAATTAGLACLILGATVILRERGSPEGLSFLVFAVVCGAWLLLFSSVYTAPDPETALVQVRLAYLAVPLIPPAAYLFAQVMLGSVHARRAEILAIWALGVGFVVLAQGTDLLLADTHQYPWGAYPIYGPAGLPFLLFFGSVLGKAIWDFWTAWRREDESFRRSRLGWITLAFAVAATGAVDFVPKYGLDVPPVGFASLLAFMVLAGWTVFRYPLVHLSARFAAGPVLDTMADPLLVCDREGRIRLANPAVKDVLGYDPGALVDRNAEELRLEESDAGEGLWGLVQGPELRDREVRLVTVNGDAVDVSVSTSHLRGARGEWAGTVVILRDVRQRKSLEAQLRQGQKMEAIGRLAAGIAHDFNNILTVIRGHTQLLLQEADPSPALRDDLLAIDDAADRAGELTRQLLQFGRAQARNPEKLDPGKVVRDFSKLVHRILGGDVEFTLELSPETALIEVDPAHIEQVLMNLVVNARDAMPRGGRISIAVFPDRVSDQEASVTPGLAPGEYVTLSVEDTGIGMDPQVRKRIFEPFYTTKEMGGGTGLGLATVYGIVKQNEGHIQVASAPGEGTRFTVRFPRVWEEDEAPAREPDTDRARPRAG